jgi:hypothetical protein
MDAKRENSEENQAGEMKEEENAVDNGKSNENKEKYGMAWAVGTLRPEDAMMHCTKKRCTLAVLRTDKAGNDKGCCSELAL